MAKLINCKTCGAQIAKSAKTCPSCGARQRNRHPVLTVILTLVLILIAIGLAVSLSEQKPTKVESTAAPRGSATAAPAQTFTVGDTAEINKVRVSLVDVRSSAGSQYSAPEKGNIFLTFELEIDNGTDAELGISSLLSFSAYADDYALTYSLTGILADGGKQLDGAIAAGKKMRGVVSFEAPEGWNTAEIHFKPNVWAGREFVFQAENAE